jgi:MFS family permease
MAEISPMIGSTLAAGHVLGRKLHSIPFSGYHVLIIGVLALVGFIEGYDLVMTGSLLVLAKTPLQLTDTEIRWLAVGPTFMLCIGGFASSAVSDHWSRKAIMLIGVVATTFLTLLIRWLKARAAARAAGGDREPRTAFLDGSVKNLNGQSASPLFLRATLVLLARTDE